MFTREGSAIDCRRVELDGVRYVILRESVFEAICHRAGLEPDAPPEESLETTLGLDRASLAERLVRRRRTVGLTQLELARRAEIRPETLNRIERGRTTPDFATVRKLVVAINTAEQESLPSAATSSSPTTDPTQEMKHDHES